MKKICLVLLCALVGNVYPCGNEYEENLLELNLRKPETTAYHNYLKHEVGFDKVSLQKLRRSYLEALRNDPHNYRVMSNIALIDLKIGDRHKAVKVLDSLVKLYPNEYNINANLGTGYELIGNNELALKYINRAVRINPASHNNSEWIHVHILLQKIKKQPDYSKVMDLHFDDALTNYKSKGLHEKLSEKRRQLAYQLNERIAFVGYDDPIVSQLLADYADLVAITDNMLSAKPVYEKALLYKGANNKDYIGRRLGELNWLETKANFKYYTPLIISSLIILAIAIFIVRNSDGTQRKRYVFALGYSVFAFGVMVFFTKIEEILFFMSPLVQFAIPAFFVVGYKHTLRFFYNLLFCALATLVIGAAMLFSSQIFEYYFLSYIKLMLPWVLCMSPYVILAFVYNFSAVFKNILVGTAVILALSLLNSNYSQSFLGHKMMDLTNIFIGYFVLFLMFIVSKNKIADKVPQNDLSPDLSK